MIRLQSTPVYLTHLIYKELLDSQPHLHSLSAIASGLSYFPTISNTPILRLTMPQISPNAPNSGYNSQADELKSQHDDRSVTTPGEAKTLHNIPMASSAEDPPRKDIQDQNRRKKRLVCYTPSYVTWFSIENASPHYQYLTFLHC